MIETVGEEEMIKHIEAPQLPVPTQSNASYRLKDLFEALVDIITDVPLW